MPLRDLKVIAVTKVSLLRLQEYYIRHMDGCTLDTEGERERVVKCLEAAIRRRISEVRQLVLQWC